MDHENTSLEIADIFRKYIHLYTKQNKLTTRQYYAVRDIISCRTPVLGGHIKKCSYCNYEIIRYNSCRNRHCPKCSAVDKEKWIIKQESRLLPTHYFHLVFTVPQEFCKIGLFNKSAIYNIAFKASIETLKNFGKHTYNGKIGDTTILHTWSQTLIFHIHTHHIIPGGILSEKGKWISTKDNFLFPVKAMEKMYKAIFIREIRKLYKNNGLELPGELSKYQKKYNFNSMVDSVYQKKWIVYAKPPFKNVNYVIKYLARYTHRIAISNRRIKSISKGMINFSYRDNKDNNKTKLMVLPAYEFIRRYLNHILPKGFVKIRHYGFMSNSAQKSDFIKCAQHFNVSINKPTTNDIENLLLRMGIDTKLCPKCKNQTLFIYKEIPKNNGPPFEYDKVA